MLTYQEKDTSDRIRKLRVKSGLSQEQAAERLGLTAGSLSRIERGQRGCSVELLACIGALYGVSMDYLVLGRQLESGMDKRALEELIRYLLALRQGLVGGMGEPVPEFPLPSVAAEP